MPNKKITTLVTILCSLIITGISFADTTPPLTSVTKTPNNPNGSNNWYKTPVQITLSGTDLESGIKEITHKTNDGDWEKTTFYQTLNLAPNPSFENPNLEGWEPSVSDSNYSVVQDFSTSLPSFGNASVKIISNGFYWHGVHNLNNFSAAEPYSSMTASAWVKTEGVSDNAYFKIYSVSLDQNNNKIKTYIGESNKITGTNNWIKLWHTFTVTNQNTIGIAIDLGLDGTGTSWYDAINIAKTSNQTNSEFYVSTDGINTIQYYSVDQAGNKEETKTLEIKIDQTPPQNWANTTVTHNIGDPDYILSAQTTVQDKTSGISNLTKEFQYKTETEYGTYDNLLDCASTWNKDNWIDLANYPTISGNNVATLATPKINFCDNIWNKCKSVRFKAIDVAGNETTKEYCINGPWIKTTNGGKVKSNQSINMIYNVSDTNSDGIIEVGNNTLEYFTTTNNHFSKGTSPIKTSNYENIWQQTVGKSEINELSTTTGIYYIPSNFIIDNIPNGFSNNTFNQVIFVNGNLTINTDIQISKTSTLLFIVKGNVEISKNVQILNSAIMSDQNIYTASDMTPGETTIPLELRGIFRANRFYLQRNMQINNQPTEYFIYEPKYLIKMKEYLKDSQIEWNN